MERKVEARIMVIFAFLATLVLAGCENHNPLPEMTIGHGDSPDSTGQWNIFRGFVQLGYATANATNTLIVFGLILVVPWLIIAIIPGILAKSLEMKIESAVMFAFTAVMFYPAFEEKALWLLLLCVAVPAFVQFWWKTETGKFALFGLPAILGSIVLLWLAFQWARHGLVFHPIIALCVVVFVAWSMVKGGGDSKPAHGH
jgi:hypothetical protein